MLNRKKKSGLPEINASSMADIAFLLLIFFLVVTKIETDKGLPILLPPWSEEEPPDIDVQDRNAFVVLVNSRNQLLVENKLTESRQLKRMAKRFINNNGVDPTLSDSPRKAVISLRGDRGTSYQTYIEVLNELRAAYNELRDEYATQKYGRPFSEFKMPDDSAEVNDVRFAYPLRISEAEPADHTKL